MFGSNYQLFVLVYLFIFIGNSDAFLNLNSNSISTILGSKVGYHLLTKHYVSVDGGPASELPKGERKIIDGRFLFF